MPRRCRSRTIFAGVLMALGSGPLLASARWLPGDAFLCAEAKPARAPRSAPPLPTFHARVGVAVVDRFTRPLPSKLYTLDLRKPESFCRPVRIDDEELTDALSGFEAYAARRTPRRPAPPPLAPTSEVIETSFGSAALRVAGVAALQVPTLATGSVGGSGPERDHFACYRARGERGGGAKRGVLRVEVRTGEGPRTVEVRKPVRLCVPASVRGEDESAPKHPLDLLCFDARVPRTRGARGAVAPETLATRNVFGHEVLKVGSARLLCVPAARTDVVVPTPTPFPTLTPPPTPTATGTPVPTPRVPTMHVVPTAVKALVHDRVCYSAFFDLPDGSSVDVTTTAVWQVDGSIAAPGGFVDGQKCFVGIAIGTTNVLARDAGTGVVSPPAELRSEWPIYALAVTPKQLGLRLGDAQPLTVSASFTNGRVRNVTQYAGYESADEHIARVPNVPGSRSRIEGAGEGRTSIVVHDLLSSLTDTTAVVVGALEKIQVEEIPMLFPGEVTHLQATGFFTAGFASNLTQDVAYESSDPSIVLAPNAPDEPNRIEAVRPGLAVITATDAASGLRSECCGNVSVFGDVLALSVSPPMLAYRKGVGGDTLALKAFGQFAIPPASQGFRAASARMTWTTTPPGVVAIAGVDADGWQRLQALGGGSAQVIATDPSSGIAAAATVVVYDRLDRVDVGTDQLDESADVEQTIVIGAASARYFAHGYFDGGRHRLLDDVRFRASPSDVVAISGNVVSGLRPGTATISVVDVPSGVGSTEAGGRDAVVHVLGDIERLVLSPATTALDVGQARTLTAVAYRVGGGVENVTQRVGYVSSDPDVVVALNEPGTRSRIMAVGAGTAVISAEDPVTGVTSATSGDDTVVTVTDRRVVRLVVSPANRRVPAASSWRFTAVAQLASGETVNVTQRAEWRSSAGDVAAAPNVAGDRSRIDALAPGTTAIAAYDPLSGVSSSDSGDDATLTVAALAALALTPVTLELPVGGAYSLTTVGVLDAGAPINVTQDVVYVSSDPTVVNATNLAGNKSRIEALAPGVATVTAFRDSEYPQATESNGITVTVLPSP